MHQPSALPIDPDGVCRRTLRGQSELVVPTHPLSALEFRLLAAVTGHTPAWVLGKLYEEEADVVPALQHLASLGMVAPVDAARPQPYN
jgi:hypothetical protein